MRIQVGLFIILCRLAAASAASIVVGAASTQQNFWKWPARKTNGPISSFLADLESIESLDGACPLLTRQRIKHDSSYRKAWTQKDWAHHQVPSLQRYFRHVASWRRSAIARSTLPTVAVAMVWSSIVHWAANSNEGLARFLESASFPVGITSFTAPISLLLALRTNRALNRLLDARSFVGMMMRATGSVAGLAALYVAEVDEEAAALMGRYLSMFGWALKGLLRDEDDTLLLHSVLPPHEALWLEQSPLDTPTTIIFKVRQLIATVNKDIPRNAAYAMESRLVELERVIGGCKRILGTPIPPSYNRHTSRVLCLFLGLLPVSMVAAKIPLAPILVIVGLLGYVFVGIDEIGMEIELPFPLLPMFLMSLRVQKNVRDQFFLASTSGD